MGSPLDTREKASSKYISKFFKKLSRLLESPRPIDSTGSNSRESDNKHTRSEAISSDWVARQEMDTKLLMRSESYIAGKKELSIGTHTGDA